LFTKSIIINFGGVLLHATPPMGLLHDSCTERLQLAWRSFTVPLHTPFFSTVHVTVMATFSYELGEWLPCRRWSLLRAPQTVRVLYGTCYHNGSFSLSTVGDWCSLPAYFPYILLNTFSSAWKKLCCRLVIAVLLLG
jgi:hypothetical protein